MYFCNSSSSYEHVFDNNLSNRTMKTFLMCAVYDTVRFDPARALWRRPVIHAQLRGRFFIMDGNVTPDAEVGTFADRKYSRKTQRNASEGFED